MRRYRWIPALFLICLAAAVLWGCRGNSRVTEKDGGLYYYDDSGAPLTGWQEIDGQRLYLDDTGRANTGIVRIDGETFLFSPDGAMATGWAELNGKYYYLRSNGTMVTGWLSLEGQRYYLNSDGSAATGICRVDGAMYVFDQTGKLCAGCWAELGSLRAHGDINGHPLTGWQEINGARYHFDSNGILSTGWQNLDGFSFYFYEDGTPAQGKVKLDGVEYTFASNGQYVVLVNPWNYMPDGYKVELTAINDEHQVASIAYADYLEMIRDCQDAGNDPAVCSSYRSFEYQKGLYNRRIERYMDEGYSKDEATELAGQSVAVPGTSEHHLGLALDIVDLNNWNLDESQAEMPTQKWLMANSWRYGWILRYPSEKSETTGIIYEPWHYRYVGREIAAEIYSLGLCLEEYLEMLTQ